MKKLKTDRLILRGFKMDDLEDLFEYAKLDTVGPHAGWMPHPSLEHSKRILSHFIESDDVWAIELEKESKVIGSIGLHLTNLNNRDKIHELGYVLSTKYENHGYMREAVKAVLEYAFNELQLEEIYVGHFIENKKSQKLISYFNFEYLNDEEYESRDYGLKKSKIYVMKRNEYIKEEK